MPRISSTTRHSRIIEDPFWAGPAEDEPTTEERFWWNVDVRDLEECWPWQGTTTTEGYGHFYIGHHGGKRFTMNAHRFSYFLANGACERGRHIHHNCENRACVNPRHLDALTPRQHTAWHRARRRIDNVRRPK